MSLSSTPYKGTRDYYPQSSVISGKGIFITEKQSYIFERIRYILHLFNYKEYRTSVLENTEAFVQKSGGDLGSKQLYNFIDKGGRDIALRPELTLSLARAISNLHGQLRFPLRWFSIDNCFRYERPQRGRTREFWQAEVDIVGLEAGPADLETLMVVLEIMRTGFKASIDQYTLYYSHRPALDIWVTEYGFEDRKEFLFSILDDWFKVDEAYKKNQLREQFNESEVATIFELANRSGEAFTRFVDITNTFDEMKLISDVFDASEMREKYSIMLHPCIIRGQAYYTGMVFEVFDTNKEYNRALFGGGRFDDLLDLYGKKAPAVGFAPSDISVNEFLEHHRLYPEFNTADVAGYFPQSHDDIVELYQKTISNNIQNETSFEIDYDLTRSMRKREESMKKRNG